MNLWIGLAIIAALVSAPISAAGYQRLRQSAELFVGIIRSAREVDGSRLLLVVSDYVDMLGRLEVLATNAVAALERSLKLSESNEDSQIQVTASGQALVGPSGQSSLP